MIQNEMSQTVLTQENLATIEPRRAPLRNADSDMNSQRQTNRRSLSGKFRNLFRRNSPSPSRPASNTVERTQSSTTRRRSPSPEPTASPSTEAPHLRAPVFNWGFGKKKNKLTGSASEKVKKKERKSVKTTTSVYEDVPQTSIRGQNFVPRTPELTHETAGRTQTSISSYETTTTKGYRGYIVIDGAKSTQQVNYLKINFSIDSKQKTTRIDVDFFTF